MSALASYLSGRWETPDGDGLPIHHAVTGDEIATVPTARFDVAGALAYGRDSGAALREPTFHQRAALLKALAGHLREHRDELYALSATTGATPADARIDVDGGIGTLLAYASRGRRELPNGHVYVEGEAEPLGKGGTFAGRHLLTPLLGVAVQINAFNFPVWGPLEKFAPAFLAGMPSLVKPAVATAHVTERLIRLVVESGLLPEGALQLLCGVPGTLLDHLTEQDTVAFTGSADTARLLRAHPVLVRRAVRFTAEADSLNCSILGPDGDAELYARQLVTEMTAKTGQKCTAIRRAFVPRDRIERVCGLVRELLDEVVVGDPADPAVTMGPLVSTAQRERVRAAVRALGGQLVFGDPDRVTAVGADAVAGAFLSPLLLAGDPERAEPHEVEAFGPVATLLPYDTTAQVIGYAARGRGSLAGSVVTEDPGFAREVVLGLAPWHGRLLVLDRADAAESTGHGSPLPGLVHGGPGRAGGGEELGGIRAVLHHMQRTAVQASPDVLAAVTGRWTTGAARTDDGVHPFRKSLAELRIGDSVTAGPRRVSAQDVAHFAEFTGDTFYAHTDEAAAAANPLFGGIVAHGYLVVAFAAGLFVAPEPGPVLANYGLENLRFRTPVKPGDSLSVTLTAKQISPRDDAPYGEVRWDTQVTNQDGAAVAGYDLLTLVAKERPA